MNPTNSYEYWVFSKLNFCFKRCTRTLSIFNFGKSTGDFHMIALCLDSNTKFYCWSAVAVLRSTSYYKHFCVYCHLTLSCVCTTRFGTCSSMCITLYVLCSGLYFCLCLLAIHITFPSFKYSALQYSFCSD